MRIMYLADGTSVHTKKWLHALLKEDHHIHLFSLKDINHNDYDLSDKLFTYSSFDLSRHRTYYGGINKLSYLKTLPAVKKSIKTFKPDLVHAHFASSYGLLGALSGFHPLIISVWGYDVFHFPHRSWIHKRLLKFNLSKADKVLSTSHVMARETALYTSSGIEVTPFGIDLNRFKCDETIQKSSITPFEDKDFVIGTAKPLEDKYAVDDLIRAFDLLVKKYPDSSLKCCIVGDGSVKTKLRALGRSLGIEEKIFFAGKIDHEEMPAFLNLMDIFVALSLEESFGVAVIEAEACEKPVIVSNEGGLPEVVDEGITGFIVDKGDYKAASRAMEKLLLDPLLRKRLGKAGREKVSNLYDWGKCVRQMCEVYQSLTDDNKTENDRI